MLPQVIDRYRRGREGEVADRAPDPRHLVERAGVLADRDVVERRVAAEPVRVHDEVASGDRLAIACRDPQRQTPELDALAEVAQGRRPDRISGQHDLVRIARQDISHGVIQHAELLESLSLELAGGDSEREEV